MNAGKAFMQRARFGSCAGRMGFQLPRSPDVHSISVMMQTSLVPVSKAPPRVQNAYNASGWAPQEFQASSEDLHEIRKYVEQRVKTSHPGNIFGDDGQLRAVHGYDDDWHPSLMNKLASRALDIIGCNSVYVYQFRVNSKSPSKTTGKWDLHRDFDFWSGMDGLPTARAVALHILVTDHTETNGPVVFVDGSHNMQACTDSKDDASWEAGFDEKSFKYTIDEQLIGNAPCVAMTGEAGTIAAMHPLTWHYSSPNLCTKPRVLMSVIFNDASNLPVQPAGIPKRPRFIVGACSRTWTRSCVTGRHVEAVGVHKRPFSTGSIGEHGWASSTINSQTMQASSKEDLKRLYAQWAATYDEEMNANDLQSYKSITSEFFSMLEQINTSDKHLRIFDAGCGSGLLGQHIMVTSAGIELPHKLELIGGDLSTDMIELAKEKGCYSTLQQVNLKEALPFANESFDFIVSSGVFLPGHCGPESLPFILATLRKGGRACITVRENMYQADRTSFQQKIEESGCELLSDKLMPYYGETNANVLVIRKFVQ